MCVHLIHTIDRQLKPGDTVCGTIRPPKEGEKYFPLVHVNLINGLKPDYIRDRQQFEYLTPLFPSEKFVLTGNGHNSMSNRIIDLFAPIGKGQRALIVDPTCIIMGAEDKGVSYEHLALCDEWIKIPMIGKIESLNVSVAAGVLIYEAVKQRGFATEE